MSIITKIRTIRLKEMPNVIWVEIENDEGLTGLGETYRASEAVEAMLHGEMAKSLIGKDSRNIESISRTLTTPYVGFHSTSTELRAASAIDIALWDLYGKRHHIPIYEALGGACRDTVPTYNTCAGYSFNVSSKAFDTGNSRRAISDEDEMQGPYDDQVAFNRDAGKLAESLLAEGYKVMKIWPFDPFAKETQGNRITQEDLAKGIEPFKKIRQAVGDKMEIMCELHSLWSLPAAIEICKALEPFNLLWVEDPLCKMGDPETLRILKNQVNVPICGSESVAGLPNFRNMLNSGGIDYAMLDLGWSGGITEACKISAIAESFSIPFAPHDCTGPVVLWAGLHVAAHSPMAIFQEVVRANMATWYKDLVTDLPKVEKGMLQLPQKPGIGTSLRPEIREREDAIIRETV